MMNFLASIYCYLHDLTLRWRTYGLKPCVEMTTKMTLDDTVKKKTKTVAKASATANRCDNPSHGHKVK